MTTFAGHDRQPRYYAHSGKFSPAGVAVGMVVGVVVAFLSAWIYAYGVYYIPIVYLSVLLCVGYAIIVGMVTAGTMAKLKVRNAPLMMACAMLVSALALYFAWGVYLYAVHSKAGRPASIMGLLLNPGKMWDGIQEINQVGLWTLGRNSKDPVKGVMLWIVWVAEAGIIFGMTAVGVNIVLDDPFCEACETWTKEQKSVALLSAANMGELMPRLEAKDFSVVAAHQRTEAGSTWVRLDMHHCKNPACGQTHALSAKLVTATVSKGKEEQSEKDLFSKLLLTKEENEALQAALSQPPPAPPTPT